jgi:hypothetical protein
LDWHDPRTIQANLIVGQYQYAVLTVCFCIADLLLNPHLKMNSIKHDHQAQDFLYTTRLTPKQQAFVDSVLAGHSYIDAYKLAYDTKSSHKVIGISANALLKNPKIIKAIHTQRLELQKSMSIALDKHNLQMHLATELKELYPKIQDEQTRIKVLEMLISISQSNSV